MPELPEVETTVRGLRKHIVGRTILSAWSDPKKPTKALDGVSWQKRRRLIEGKKVVSVTRRAKYIVINFSKSDSLYIHQKMSGHLLSGRWKYQDGEWRVVGDGPLGDTKNQHIRAMLTLDNGSQIALSDTRRFATITYVRDSSEHIHLSRLGPEPLEMKLSAFHAIFNKKKGRLKPVLMDPYFIVGIGNIYADEILWASGLHPLSRVNKLDSTDRAVVFKNMQAILMRAIKAGGSSVDDYRTTTGEAGEFQNDLNAYQRTDEKCAKGDGGTIKRIVVGQRSTHFCPKHQIKNEDTKVKY